jgi:DNA-directed RNA polymerase subunit RPC12/RpoP
LVIASIVLFACFSVSLCSVNKKSEPSGFQFNRETVEEQNGFKDDVVIKRNFVTSSVHRLFNSKLTVLFAFIGFLLSLIALDFIKRKEGKCPRCGTLVYNEIGGSYKSAFCPHCGFKREYKEIF